MSPPVSARFFRSPAAFRQWLARNHDRATEVWVGFHRKASGRTGLRYAEALDVALCFGWIDGVRKRLDETSYTNRFSPRKPGSIWSHVNVAHVERLTAAGLMHEAGLAAYARRDPERTGVYSFEQRPDAFPEPLAARFRAHAAAWQSFGDQPPGYRRLAIWWVVSAKREDTRLRRLQQLIEASARGHRVGALFGQPGTVPSPAPRAERPRAPRAKASTPGDRSRRP